MKTILTLTAFIILTGYNCKSAAPDANDIAAKEAFMKVGQKFTYCGGTGSSLFLHEKGNAEEPMHMIYQLSDLHWSYYAAPITEADKLNGITWKGEIKFNSKAYRNSEGFNKGSTPSWNSWQDAPPDKPIFVFLVTKTGNNWTIVPNRLETDGNYRPVILVPQIEDPEPIPTGVPLPSEHSPVFAQIKQGVDAFGKRDHWKKEDGDRLIAYYTEAIQIDGVHLFEPLGVLVQGHILCV
jgi:hypothetical protein